MVEVVVELTGLPFVPPIDYPVTAAGMKIYSPLHTHPLYIEGIAGV